MDRFWNLSQKLSQKHPNSVFKHQHLNKKFAKFLENLYWRWNVFLELRLLCKKLDRLSVGIDMLAQQPKHYVNRNRWQKDNLGVFGKEKLFVLGIE